MQDKIQLEKFKDGVKVRKKEPALTLFFFSTKKEGTNIIMVIQSVCEILRSAIEAIERLHLIDVF